MMLNDNSVLIIENTNEGLTINRDDVNDFYLSGIAAKFGIKNNNNRVYEANEYLPHLQYLNEKIARKQLFGEMDHPQNYDVSLKNVSHVIESLSFDPNDNTVKIKVRLLDTPCGRIAKTLVEAGCTVSISSRAAGQVMNEGKVKLQRIFTYDLVAEPGFSEAMLKRGLNEGLNNNLDIINESYTNLKSSSILNKMQDVSENYNFENNVKIYKLNNMSTKPENNNNQPMSEFVSKSDFQRYSASLKQKFNALSENVQTLSNSSKEAIDVNKLAAYTTYLAEELKTVIKFNNYLAEKVQENISYTEHVAETTNNAIDYADYLSEKVSQNISFSEYLGEKLNQSLNYAEYLAEKLNSGLSYSEYLGEKLNQGLNYTEYIGEKVNDAIAFTDYIVEQVNNVIDHSDHIVEHVNKSIKYSEYIGENLSKNIQFADYLAEGLNSVAGNPIKKMVTDVNSVNESASTEDIVKVEENSIDSITSAVSKIAKTIKSKNANAVLESQYPFLKLLSADNKAVFMNLDSKIKADVVKVLGTAVWTNESEIVSLMNAVSDKAHENVPAYIRFMPTQYKEIYESMNDVEKNRIASQAYNYQLHTPYQIKSFWDTRDLKGIRERIYEEANINKIQQQVNESQSKEGYISLASVQDKNRGYSLSYVDRILRQSSRK